MSCNRRNAANIHVRLAGQRRMTPSERSNALASLQAGENLADLILEATRQLRQAGTDFGRVWRRAVQNISQVGRTYLFDKR